MNLGVPQYLIAARDQQHQVELQQTVQNIALRFPGVELVRLSPSEGVAIVSIPNQMIQAFKKELPRGYHIEPNSTLGY